MQKLCVATVIAISIGSAAPAASFISIVDLISPSGDISASRVTLLWETDTTTGTIDQNDLTALTFQLFDDTLLVFEDIAIAGGAVQDLGGISRMLGDNIVFEFSFDDFGTSSALGLNEFDNDLNVDQDGTATGTTTFNIYGGLALPFAAQADEYIDGDIGEFVTADAASFTTLRNEIPVPATLPLMLSAVAALGWFARRRA